MGLVLYPDVCKNDDNLVCVLHSVRLSGVSMIARDLFGGVG